MSSSGLLDNYGSGELHLIFGPMFSGKTSELLKRIRLYRLSNRKCAVIHYAKDTRYTAENCISTHNGIQTQSIRTLSLLDIKDQIVDADVIGIDEGQFFSDIEAFCRDQIEYGKIVIVDGLDATYMRTPFQNMLDLVPLSHSVLKLSAICMSCGSKAAFTKRIGTETEIELIGGFDKYMAVCRECYKKPCPEKSSPFKRMEKIRNEPKIPESPFTKCKRKILSEL